MGTKPWRLHTGVHNPGDVTIGAIVGSGIAAMVGAACDLAFQASQRGRVSLG